VHAFEQGRNPWTFSHDLFSKSPNAIPINQVALLSVAL
jgi:hypothetical protein